MTTKRICEEAGMSAGILSYYFKGKEDVLFAMVRLNNRLLMEAVAKGLALGTSAHAVGTAKALEMGEIEGAMSSLSIAVAGLLTVVAVPLMANLI